MATPVALVTGASRGIGREIARALAARGVTVYAGVRAGAAPPGTVPVALEVNDEAQVAAAVALIRAEAGHLDLLVNNAAILHDRDGAILAVPPAVLEETLRVNVVAPLRLAQACWPLLARGARVINVSSSGGQLSQGASGWSPAYCTSKSALNALTLHLAAAGRAAGISVNAMCPGWVRTDMGGPGAPRSVKEGADTAVWLALEAPPSLTGAFVQDRRVIPW
jgi:NAD(P)-dependent dehydrogenase (short-subunit alcohol dehydrogenase family)